MWLLTSSVRGMSARAQPASAAGRAGSLEIAFNAFPPVSALLSLLGFFGVPQNGLRVTAVEGNRAGPA